MVNDNDPIKEYKPFRFGRNDESFNIKDDSPTDLHDCSNDLSASGSRKEEFEHAKFADKVRQRQLENQYYQAKYEIPWNRKAVNDSKKNNVVPIIIVIVILIILTNFLPIIVNIVEKYEVDEIIYQEEMDEDVSELAFEIYKSNISLNLYKTADGSSFVQLYNANDKSFSDLKIEIVFYDEMGSILKIEDVYTNLLIAKNEHFFEVFDAPMEYARYEYNIVNSYGEYSDVTKEDIYINMENDGLDGKITVNNYTDEEIDSAEIVVSYFKGNELIDVVTCYFFDLEIGKEQSENFYFYGQTEIDEIRVTLNNVNIY